LGQCEDVCGIDVVGAYVGALLVKILLGCVGCSISRIGDLDVDL
jgi:hypothetical protein